MALNLAVLQRRLRQVGASNPGVPPAEFEEGGSSFSDVDTVGASMRVVSWSWQADVAAERAVDMVTRASEAAQGEGPASLISVGIVT